MSCTGPLASAAAKPPPNDTLPCAPAGRLATVAFTVFPAAAAPQKLSTAAVISAWEKYYTLMVDVPVPSTTQATPPFPWVMLNW